MYFGKNIKKIRLIKKLSQSAFAEVFGLTRSSIGAYEEGRAEPKLEIIIKIANYFSISVDSLVNAEITVNELSHFHLLDDYLNNNVLKERLTNAIEITEIPIVSIINVQQMTLVDAIKGSKNKISLPDLESNCVSILVDVSFLQSKPKHINNKDVIIVNPNCELNTVDLQNRYCLVKRENELSILEVNRINGEKYLLYTTNALPLTINNNEFEFILPIEKHISNVPMVIDNASDKIKKLELMVNDLYNKLE